MTAIQFKQEWSESDHKFARKSILSYLKSRLFESYKSDQHPAMIGAFHGCTRFVHFSNALGLAYTSSSSYAGLWACSDQISLDCERVYNLIGFAIGSKNSVVYAIWWDNNENEIVFPISK